MRAAIKDFTKTVAETLPILEPIYEFGSYQVLGQEELANLRPFFPGKKYVGTDLREGTGVDAVLDVHNIDLPSESVGTVLCLDTLEHVEYPRKTIEELNRILKRNGMLVIRQRNIQQKEAVKKSWKYIKMFNRKIATTEIQFLFFGYASQYLFYRS